MQLSCFFLAIATVLLTASGPLSSAARVQDTTPLRSTTFALHHVQSNQTRRLRRLEATDTDTSATNQEERYPLSSVKNVFTSAANGLKKSTAEAIQALAAAKKARAVIKKAKAEAKFKEMMKDDKFIAKKYREAKSSWISHISRGKSDANFPVDAKFKRILDATKGNEDYLVKVMGALKAAKVDADDVRKTLNIANSREYAEFYRRYSTY